MYKREEESILKSVDWTIIFIYLVLVFCGWISIYAASYEYDHIVSMFDFSGRAGKQLVWIGASLVIGFILLKLDDSLYDTLAYFIYILLVLLLILTIFIAPDIKGSKSWLIITDSIRLQPAEFSKFGVALALAKYMSSYNFKLMTVKNLLAVGLIIFVPFVLIILQNETGSALVYSAFILVLYREGLPGTVLAFAGIAVALFVVGLKFSGVELGYDVSLGGLLSVVLVIIVSIGMLFVYTKERRDIRIIALSAFIVFLGTYLLDKTEIISINWGLVTLVAFTAFLLALIVLGIQKRNSTFLFIVVFAICSIGYVSSVDYFFSDVLQPHQQQRIKVTLGMEEDALGAGYNVNQSKIAIGSGGLVGKGFLNGTQTKLKYVPEQDTDFIFCTVGEEHGFVGTVFVLFMFGFLIVRLIILAEHQKTAFARVYGYCVASILFFHLFVNIGMVIGITPVIGIPLPFFSYGGSSLWGFTILLFIFLRLDMARKRR